ncbi:MAG: SHOCT domain-containing protein [Burkholderiaceae bacterium]
MHYDGGWFTGGGHFLGWIFWILILAAIAWLIWGRQRTDRPGQPPAADESPMEILQRRLANGECTPEEYEARKALLERDAPKRA